MDTQNLILYNIIPCHFLWKKTGSCKFGSKFETLRRQFKTDIKQQHDLYVNNLVGGLKANHRDFYRYINSQKKEREGIPPLKTRKMPNGIMDGFFKL